MQPQDPIIPTSEQPADTFVNKDKVLQPVSDMSEYAPKPAESTFQPSQLSEEAVHKPGKQFDPSKIYPDDTHSLEKSDTEPLSDKDEKIIDLRRVSARVPLLKTYAIITMCFSVVSLVGFVPFFLMTGMFHSIGRAGASNGLGLILLSVLILLPIVAINIAMGLYLLLAKSAKAVSIVLTILLVLGGINILRTLAGLAVTITHVSIVSVVSLAIGIVILWLVWNIKTQVDSLDL